MSEPAAVEAPTTFGWRGLGMTAAVGMVIWLIAGFFLLGGVDPFAAGFALIYGVISILLRREGRVGPIALLIVSGLLVLMIAIIGSADLVHPESWRGFVGTLGVLLLAATGVLAGTGVLRGWGIDWAARIGVSAAAILITGVVLGLGAAASLENDTAQPGDLVVTAQDVRFHSTGLVAPGGTVSVFVKNQDPIRHTFTIRALGVDLELPAGTDRRTTFEAREGTYTVVCDIPGHEAMSLALTIEG
ncbi:MAG: cupredoxin domain-containing protein [Acidimicrobiia bacterium]